MKTRRPFIIDCDTGTDDSLMLAAAIYCEEIDIKAITSCNGNVGESAVANNNINLMEYFGADIPVARGAQRSMYDRAINEGDCHGPSGLGDIVIPAAKHKKAVDTIASELIYQTAVAEKGELELLVTGPMTNLALAIIQHNDLPGLIKKLWFMGGAVYGGNINNNSEFNIWADPIAAHIVFTSGIRDAVMVGLDVTLKAIMEQEDVDELRTVDTRACSFSADMLQYMIDQEEKRHEGAVMHDALALAAALYPECMTYEDYFMDVEWQGTLTAGHTAADTGNKTGEAPNIHVAMGIDTPKFRRWLVDTIKKSSKQ